MSAAKHTLGPWEFAWEDGKHGVLASEIGKFVAIIVNNDPEDGLEGMRKANGYLMAAGPDMLKILKSLDCRWSSDFSSPEDPAAIARFTRRQIKEWALIRAVIAKAQGRS